MMESGNTEVLFLMGQPIIKIQGQALHTLLWQNVCFPTVICAARS